jgi:hypothetical protein
VAKKKNTGIGFVIFATLRKEATYWLRSYKNEFMSHQNRTNRGQPQGNQIGGTGLAGMATTRPSDTTLR